MKSNTIREKLTPELLAMLDDMAAGLSAEVLGQRYARQGVIADQPDKPIRVIVLVDCEPGADFMHLLVDDIRVNQSTGTPRTVFLPLAQLGRLTLQAEVLRIHPSKTLAVAMDLAVKSVGLPAFRTATALSGRGVIIGIVDTGFDPRHKALKQRILRAWDQRDRTPGGQGVAEGQYGVELRGREIEDKLRDESGHGTHVAAIAGGGAAAIAIGGVTDYPGIATGAEFVLVRSSLNDGHIQDGLRYIFRVAHEMGRPAVVNLSVSSAPGLYDGSDMLCRTIDQLTGAGKIICCAAGNYGESRAHALLALGQGEEVSLTFGFDMDIGRGQVQGVFGKQQQIALAVGPANGTPTVFFHSQILGSQDLGQRIRGEFNELAPGSPLRKFNVWLPEAALRESRAWQLILRPDGITRGRVDLWLTGERTDGRMTTKDDLWFDGHVDDTMTIGSPGVAAQAITVASYTTRTEWKSRAGRRQQRAATLHDISPFSSVGPIVNGVQKPDVAAPGAWIISASAMGVSIDSALQINDAYSVRDGTSMATGFVTGLVALLLEQNHALTPENAKNLLKSICRIPNKTPGTFDPRWGFGLPDIARLA